MTVPTHARPRYLGIYKKDGEPVIVMALFAVGLCCEVSHWRLRDVEAILLAHKAHEDSHPSPSACTQNDGLGLYVKHTPATFWRRARRRLQHVDVQETMQLATYNLRLKDITFADSQPPTAELISFRKIPTVHLNRVSAQYLRRCQIVPRPLPAVERRKIKAVAAASSVPSMLK